MNTEVQENLISFHEETLFPRKVARSLDEIIEDLKNVVFGEFVVLFINILNEVLCKTFEKEAKAGPHIDEQPDSREGSPEFDTGTDSLFTPARRIRKSDFRSVLHLIWSFQFLSKLPKLVIWQIISLISRSLHLLGRLSPPLFSLSGVMPI